MVARRVRKDRDIHPLVGVSENSRKVYTFASVGSGQNRRRKQTDNRAWVTETFTVSEKWFSKLVQYAEEQPTVDAFASERNNRVQRYWTRKDDAFDQDWGSEYLWLNPPFSQMEKVIRKILTEVAR